MKWKDEPPKEGTQRVMWKKFLWFPKRIRYETRWLETASWKEEVEYHYYLIQPGHIPKGTMGYGPWYFKWKALEWVN